MRILFGTTALVSFIVSVYDFIGFFYSGLIMWLFAAILFGLASGFFIIRTIRGE